MRIKAIDAAWIADKALDAYAENVIASEAVGDLASSDRVSLYADSSVFGLFGEVYDDAISYDAVHSDVVLVIVGCFPLMRNGGLSMMNRYECANERLLRSHGISVAQFLEFFEKFIQLKCSDGIMTEDGGVIWLKDRRASVEDWKNALVERFGRSICDFDKGTPFSENPNFISSVDPQKCGFAELDPLSRFKLRKTVRKIL